MANHNGQSVDPGNSEDRIAELLVAYDDALAHGAEAEFDLSAADLDAESAAKLESLAIKARAFRRASHTLAMTSGGTRGSTRVEMLKDESAAADSPGDSVPADGVPESPKALGRFEIIRELGSGGSGIVLLARDPTLGRLVALKIPRPETFFAKDLRRRFLREAQAAARLTHPNVVPIYEVGEAGSICYIAAVYCEGPDLAAWLTSHSKFVDVRSAAAMIAQLADGIEFAHGEGILHRDLKPANVMLEPLARPVPKHESEADALSQFRPRITDFGLAKLETSEAARTRTGAMLGTIPYLAPEQADASHGGIGRQTDVYGLGMILYELLTGVRPFRGRSEAETLRKILNDDPPPPGKIRSDVPRDLEAICLRCLAKNAQRRYPTAAELAADLRRFLAGEPTLARPLTKTQRLIHWTRRRPALATLLAVSVAASLVIFGLVAAYILQTVRARETAEQLQAEAETSAENAGRFMYAAHMKRAYEHLAIGDIQVATKLLDEFNPGTRFASLRGFEWHHLRRQLHGERATLKGHRGEVYAVAFSPAEPMLASGGQDGLIKLWDTRDGAELAILRGHSSCVNALVYTQDGQTIASA